MKTTYTREPQRIEKWGRKIRLNFDIETVDEEGEDGETETFYRCRTAEFDATASRDDKIEAVIATKYPTYGKEFAAINNGGEEADEYYAFRRKAKDLVDEVFGYKK